MVEQAVVEQAIVAQAMLADAEHGRLHRFDLLTAALVAERHSPTQRQQFERQLERHVALLREQLAGAPVPVETLFTYLHANILTGQFAADCHAIGESLETGRFNCLSGTLLFVGLAERCGLRAQAVLATSHVYARAFNGDRGENVETTCPAWFRRSASQREAWLRAALGDTSTADAQRSLSSTELLALVYYNRGVERFVRRDFPAAAADNLVALRLDPANSAAADNLLAAVNNWSLAAARDGQFDLARELLQRGRSIAPQRADLQASQRYVAARLRMRTSRPGPQDLPASDSAALRLEGVDHHEQPVGKGD